MCRICEESNQKGLRIGRVNKEICWKKLTHVLVHTGRISVRLMVPKLTYFFFGGRMSVIKWWPASKAYISTWNQWNWPYVDDQITLADTVKLRIWKWNHVGLGPQSIDDCPYKRKEKRGSEIGAINQEHGDLAVVIRNQKSGIEQTFPQSLRKEPTPWNFGFRLLASKTDRE